MLAPLRPCGPTCTTLTRGGRCPQHARPASAPWNPDAPPRIRGRALQQLRRALFDREPLCRLCAYHQRVTVATIRDHIVPMAEGGTEDSWNIQPLCQTCSDLKTHDESRRGQAL